MGRRGNLEEFIGPYLFLASDASSYVTGQIIGVDGGYSCW
jgi:NAD(P)-dependent dehydrogenase (short-subunit alcohol dehydrogenase family)